MKAGFCNSLFYIMLIMLIILGMAPGMVHALGDNESSVSDSGSSDTGDSVSDSGSSDTGDSVSDSGSSDSGDSVSDSGSSDTDTGDSNTDKGDSDSVSDNGSSDSGSDNGSSDSGSDNGSSDSGSDNGNSSTDPNDGGSDSGSDNGSSDSGSDNGSLDPGSDNGSLDPGSDNGSLDPGSDNGSLDPGSDNESSDPGSDNESSDTGDSVSDNKSSDTGNSDSGDANSDESSDSGNSGTKNSDTVSSDTSSDTGNSDTKNSDTVSSDTSSDTQTSDNTSSDNESSGTESSDTISADNESSDTGNDDSNSSSNSGMTLVSSEPATNIAVRELATESIISGYPVQFNFAKNATCIVKIEFDPKKTFRKTTTVVEELKNRSTLVPTSPEGTAYKYVNIWVGDRGAGLPTSIKSGFVEFKVEKAWIKDNNISEAQVVLQRYDNNWQPLYTEKVGEDENYIYFKSETPGYSFFAITEYTGQNIMKINGAGKIQETLRNLGTEGRAVLYGSAGNESSMIKNPMGAARILMAISLPLFMLLVGYGIFKKKI